MDSSIIDINISNNDNNDQLLQSQSQQSQSPITSTQTNEQIMLLQQQEIIERLQSDIEIFKKSAAILKGKIMSNSSAIKLYESKKTESIQLKSEIDQLKSQNKLQENTIINLNRQLSNKNNSSGNGINNGINNNGDKTVLNDNMTLKYQLEEVLSGREQYEIERSNLKSTIDELKKELKEKESEKLAIVSLNVQLNAKVSNYHTMSENTDNKNKQLDQLREYKKKYFDSKKINDKLIVDNESYRTKLLNYKCYDCGIDVVNRNATTFTTTTTTTTLTSNRSIGGGRKKSSRTTGRKRKNNNSFDSDDDQDDDYNQIEILDENDNGNGNNNNEEDNGFNEQDHDGGGMDMTYDDNPDNMTLGQFRELENKTTTAEKEIEKVMEEDDLDFGTSDTQINNDTVKNDDIDSHEWEAVPKASNDAQPKELDLSPIIITKTTESTTTQPHIVSIAQPPIVPLTKQPIVSITPPSITKTTPPPPITRSRASAAAATTISQPPHSLPTPSMAKSSPPKSPAPPQAPVLQNKEEESESESSGSESESDLEDLFGNISQIKEDEDKRLKLIEEERLKKLNQDKLEKEQQLKLQQQQQEIEKQKVEKEKLKLLEEERVKKLNQDKLEKEQQQEREKLEKLEKQRLEKEKELQHKLEREKERQRLEKEKNEKLEKFRLEKLEKDKQEKEIKDKLEKERLEKVKQEKERLLKLEKEKLEKEKLDKLEKEREKLEKEKLEKEKVESLDKEMVDITSSPPIVVGSSTIESSIVEPTTTESTPTIVSVETTSTTTESTSTESSTVEPITTESTPIVSVEITTTAESIIATPPIIPKPPTSKKAIPKKSTISKSTNKHVNLPTNNNNTPPQQEQLTPSTTSYEKTPIILPTITQTPPQPSQLPISLSFEEITSELSVHSPMSPGIFDHQNSPDKNQLSNNNRTIKKVAAKESSLKVNKRKTSEIGDVVVTQPAPEKKNRRPANELPPISIPSQKQQPTKEDQEDQVEELPLPPSQKPKPTTTTTTTKIIDKSKFLKYSYFKKILSTISSIGKIEKAQQLLSFESFQENGGASESIWIRKLIISIIEHLLELYSTIPITSKLSASGTTIPVLHKMFYPYVFFIARLYNSNGNFKIEFTRSLIGNMVAGNTFSRGNSSKFKATTLGQQIFICQIFSSICHLLGQQYPIQMFLFELLKEQTIRMDFFLTVHSIVPYIFKYDDLFNTTCIPILMHKHKSIKDNTVHDRKFKKFFQLVNVPTTLPSVDLIKISKSLFLEFDRLVVAFNSKFSSELENIDDQHELEIVKRAIEQQSITQFRSVLLCLELLSIHIGWVWAHDTLVASKLWEAAGELRNDDAQNIVINSMGSICGNIFTDSLDKQGFDILKSTLFGAISTVDPTFTSFKMNILLALFQIINSYQVQADKDKDLAKLSEFYSILSDNEKSQFPKIIQTLFN